MKFKYFRDPDNFAFKIEHNSKCSICDESGLWFDAGGYYGINEIECICDNCLLSGKLKELEIETNEAFEGTTDSKETIIYKTPSLPTWQDREWPFINGDYCIFEKIASKQDFKDKKELKQSLSDYYRDSTDIDWLWDMLPDTKITNINNGNFNISVYLFTTGGNKYCTWDAS